MLPDPKIPMCYYVQEKDIEQERAHPNSVQKLPHASEGLFMWNQALFVLAQLLTAGLIHINELDPIRRYLPSYNRPRKGGRYSAFQVLHHLSTPSLKTLEMSHVINTFFVFRQAKPCFVSNWSSLIRFVVLLGLGHDLYL